MTIAQAEQDQLQDGQDDMAMPFRLARWVYRRFRPALGWTIFIATMSLAMLPYLALRWSSWIDLGTGQWTLFWAPFLAVTYVWVQSGWRASESQHARRLWKSVGATVLFAIVGVLVVSQLLVNWIPGPQAIVTAVQSGNPGLLVQIPYEQLFRFGSRAQLWWQGVTAGGAAQDNQVFTAIAAMTLWIVGGLTAWMVRRFRQGLFAALPSLWLTGSILLYSSVGRGLLVMGLAVALILHILLDHDTRVRRWQSRGADYHTGVLLDRFLMVISASALILGLAAIVPNLYFQPLVDRYYELIGPGIEKQEAWKERLFPDLAGTSRFRGDGLAGGLPNEFLLRAGPALTDAIVLTFRTNETSFGSYDFPFDEMAPPPGHYMRGGTLTVYDGLGWSNPPAAERDQVRADEAFGAGALAGRKEVVQSVTLEFSSQILYTIPEPTEVSVEFRLDRRASGDIVALRGRARSYTVVSQVPAVDDAMLVGEAAWGPENPLPAELQAHLQLPDTVTERTRQLAADLTDNLDSSFAKAEAIEQYLRTYEYDLQVSEPPDNVQDVADYFLFDLQRGYCDYYASAFIVLARLAGLPSRFATGFAVGQWDPVEGIWIVTEAEAHSWPEVYFPNYGWIPFEPTAGRPELARIAAPQPSSFSPSTASSTEEVDVDEEHVTWTWQTWLWLVPLTVLVWGAFQLVGSLRRRRVDPWQGLLQWGQRSGRPMAAGETILEYGHGLAVHVINRQTREPDTGRYVANEVRALSEDVNAERYGPETSKEHAAARAAEHWERLRGYLKSLRVR